MRQRKDGPVVQLVRTLACHARGRGFEPHPGRHLAAIAQSVERILGKDEVSSSNLLSSSMVEPFRNLPKGLVFCLQTENFLTEKWVKKIIRKSKILVDRLPFFWYSNKAPGERGNRIKGYSSAGRAAVSKTACRGFESFCPCQKPVNAKAFTGFFAFERKQRDGDKMTRSRA